MSDVQSAWFFPHPPIPCPVANGSRIQTALLPGSLAPAGAVGLPAILRCGCIRQGPSPRVARLRGGYLASGGWLAAELCNRPGANKRRVSLGRDTRRYSSVRRGALRFGPCALFT